MLAALPRLPRRIIAQGARTRLPSTTAAMISSGGGWRLLGTPPAELLLANTLPTGQSFRWRRTDDDGAAAAGVAPDAAPDAAAGGSSSSIQGHGEMYTGVIGQRVVQLRQLPGDVAWRVVARGPGAAPDGDEAALADYFQLSISLRELVADWSRRDAHFAAVAPHLPGCRMLRQDPVECLFSFICSSNNHISRIHGMVEKLCSSYGSPLLSLDSSSSSAGSGAADSSSTQQVPGQAHQATAQQAASEQGQPAVSKKAVKKAKGQSQAAPSLSFFAFPTLQQLAAATEDELRAAGFGYRAKFITGSAAQLAAQPGGGDAWLQALRRATYAEAASALCCLPGVGPKVAACVCLFSLDKAEAIPVDTHVWRLATQVYARHLASKTLSAALHGQVQDAFVAAFGPAAGWAHNTLFVSQLASHAPLLPAGLGPAGGRSSQGRRRRSSKGAGDGESSSEGEGEQAAAADDAEWSPVGAARGSDGGGVRDAGSSSKRKRGAASGGGKAARRRQQQLEEDVDEAAAGPGLLPLLTQAAAADDDAAAGQAARRGGRRRMRNRKYDGAAGGD